MFDVGFSELVVIALVALIVIGPERLPKVARTVGHLLGRLQRYVNEVKADVNREMQLEEVKKLQAQLAEQAKALEQSATQQIRETEASLNQAVAGTPAAAEATAVAAIPAAVGTASATTASTVEAAAAAPSVAVASGDSATAAVAPSEAGDAANQLQLGFDHPAEKPKA